MTPTLFRELLTPTGQELLAQLQSLNPREADFLKIHQRLTKAFPSELVKAAFETNILRQKGLSKFKLAEQMFFSRAGLEQSSSEVISRYRASRFPASCVIIDLCCGLGGDLIGLAEQHSVIGVDLDELRLLMAGENLRAYGLQESVRLIQHDASRFVDPTATAVFFDPDRRSDGERHVSVQQYQPAIPQVLANYPSGFPICIKIAPGVSHQEISMFDCEAEFISVDGELKECVLWFGPLRTARRRATILPSGLTMAADFASPAREPLPPSGYLYDPDPSLLRAGLVTNFADEINAFPIHPEIAYLTSSTRTETPWATVYEIEEMLPFNGKKLGEALKSRQVGHVSITKRGSAVNVDDLRKQWKLTGKETRTVILTRTLEGPISIIARRI